MALRQRTNAYWAKRANERLVASEKTSDKYRREIRKVYTQAQRDTLEQLKKIYADYWTKDGGFDKQKLRLMTSSKDMNAFVAKLKKAGLYDKIPENYLGRINRLEFLNAQMWYESHLAGMKQDGILTSANRQVYEDSYYRSIYDVSKGIGSTPSFTMLDKQTVNQILDTEFDGKKVSKMSELQEAIAQHRPGDKVTIKYLRNKKSHTETVTLRNSQGTTKVMEEVDLDQLGVQMKPVSDEEKKTMNITYGLTINAIRNGKMKTAGAAKGTIVLQVNDQKMNTVEDWEEAVKSANQSTDRTLWIKALTPSGRKVSYVIDLNE